jgi:hypothetical protein
MNFKVSRYGWIPYLPDHRDYLYTAPLEVVGALPASVDLRAQCPPVYDQGELGSCMANAVAGAIRFDQMKQKLAEIFMPPRILPVISGQFVWFND